MIGPIIEFKYPRLKEEFDRIDGRLRFIIYAAAGYLYNKHRKPLRLTELERTQEMQDGYYGNLPEYKINPWKSVHQHGRGADISVLDLTKEEYTDLQIYINKHIIYGNGHASCIVHNVGQGIHYHLQVSYEGFSKLV